jgi:hypothetical protein
MIDLELSGLYDDQREEMAKSSRVGEYKLLINLLAQIVSKLSVILNYLVYYSE